MSLKNILVCAFTVIVSITLGQKKSVDSIKIILNLSIPDSVKMEKLYQYSKTGDKDSWQDMNALKAYKQLAVKNNIPIKICFANDEIGYKYQMKGFSDSAFKIYKESVDISLKNNDSSLWVRSVYKLGYLLSTIKQNEKAISYFELIENHIKNPAGKASIQIAIGANYMDMEENNLAIDYLHRALQYFESSDEVTVQHEYIYSNLGSIYLNKNNIELAEKYYSKTKEAAEKLNDQGGIIMAYMNLASLSNKKEKYRQALSYLKSIEDKVYTDFDDYKKLNFEYEYYKAYKGVNNLPKALEFLNKAYERRNELYKEENTKSMSDLEQKYQNKNKQLQIENQKLLITQKETEKSLITAQKKKQTAIFILVIGGLLANGIFIYNRYLKSKRDQKTILQQKNLIQEKQKEILDSINYAKRLQEAIIPSDTYWQSKLKDSFVLYIPKDIVAGDFYWMETSGDKLLFAAADCTGHGVPGAMVSVICSNAMNRAIKEFKLTDPGQILDKVRELVLETFEKSDSEVNDGMDISFCSLDLNTKKLKWAGANNPIWIIRADKGELEEIKPNKQPIGKFLNPTPFTTHEIALNPKDIVYCFTDGYADQFGGPKGKKLMYKKLKEQLLNIANLSVSEQKEKLVETFNFWKGDLEQVDDVTLVGFRI
ncbi:MAG: SpoIIE family protein phosphatase [Bacteroidia bacterium]